MADIEIIKNAIHLNRQQLLDELLSTLGVDEIDETLFQEMLECISRYDQERFRLNKALEGQEIVDTVLKDKLL
jgi:hypothetical protein